MKLIVKNAALPLIFLLVLFCFADEAAAMPSESDGPGEEPLAEELRARFKGESFSLGILLQTQGFFSFRDNDFIGGRSWDLGSTRIDFRGTVDRNFTYRVRVYYLSQQQSIDARVGYWFNADTEIVAGAFKPFLSRELDPSPGRTDFVRRARFVGAMMNSLEVGTSLLGKTGPLNYRFGIYNGTGVQGMRGNTDNRFLYTGRVFGSVPVNGHSLIMGLSAALNQSPDARVGNSGLTSKGDRYFYGGYLDYRADTFFVSTEWVQTFFDAVEYGNNRETITGFHATAGFRVGPRHELLARYDYLDFRLIPDARDRFLAGLNYYPSSLITFRLNAIVEPDRRAGTQTGVAAVFQYMF
ncbi:Phosphate-selective porin O and P [Cyclonatronum proteinivorum]|uniref:Phosphate-selective porin O and P n=1 Tax=Cyclonatronum proteinivorum TaxID=1457365 RepID=A0A345UJS2_9BACT|nr:hypothetical protein [Cyclonatronum proteinivorum]AXJ00724.1 Phosphate-selective porin O and P [Cyclonatronum proteinivorum]